MRHDNSTIRHDKKLKFSLEFQKVTTFLLVQLSDRIWETYLEYRMYCIKFCFNILRSNCAVAQLGPFQRPVMEFFSKHELLITQKIHWITSAVNIFSYMESLSITYSFADSEKAPVHVSDRLIFCCGNLILHQIEK